LAVSGLALAQPAPPSETAPMPKPAQSGPETAPPPAVVDAGKTAPPAGAVMELPPPPLAEPGCGTCARVCGDGCSFWFTTEYLHWWTKDTQLPPLAATGSANGLGGVLGQDNTQVLFGNGNLGHAERSGARFTLGVWLDQYEDFGAVFNYFFLGARGADFDVRSSGAPGSPVLTRPFFDVTTGQESASLIALPGVLSGEIHATSSSFFQGTEDDVTFRLWCGDNWRVDLLVGFCYLNLDENLDIGSVSTVTPNIPFFAGQSTTVVDQFQTKNRYYGGQVGTRADVSWGRFGLQFKGSVALGSTHEILEISGGTVFQSPALGLVAIAPSGLLTQPTNIGTLGGFSRNSFAVVPEVGLNLTYQINCRWRALLGYNFLYCSEVLRPGDQIDRVINTTQLPSLAGPSQLVGAPRPSVLFKESDFWAQGLSLGLEFHY
jgi:hypothetical protein